MSEFTEQNLMPNKFTSDSWVVLSPIERSIKSKIERVGKPLKEWDVKINFGVKTGLNEAFIIDGKTKDELIKNSPKSADVIRPILRGRDIKRYKADFADLWLLNIHNGTDSTPPIDINDYPEIKAHLDQFYPALEKRQDKGITPYNLRSCIYTDDFSKQKILWKRIGSILRFCYDDTGCMGLDSTCFATGSHIKYLLAVLNSPIGHYQLQNSPKTGTGDLLISVQALEPIYVPKPDEELNMKISTLIDQILTCDDGKTIETTEKQVNRLIFSAYSLTEEEVSFIDSL